jgi:hypothetical protein
MVHKGGCNVRVAKSTDSEVLRIKPFRDLVKGTLEGEWLRLEGDRGYILMRRSGKQFVESCAEEELSARAWALISLLSWGRPAQP